MADVHDLNTHQDGNGVEQIDENDRIINSAQAIREGIIAKLMEKGVPADMEDRTFLTQTLNGLTGTALGNKKVKASEKQAANQAQIVKNLAEAVRIGMSASAGARRARVEELREVPKLDPKVVPGHTAIGTFPVSTTSIAVGGNGDMPTT